MHQTLHLGIVALVLSVLVIFTQSSEASARELECDLALEGEVNQETVMQFISTATSKLEALKSEYSSVGPTEDFMSRWPLIACLNSPGGEFAAGIELARFLNTGIATMIPEGGVCASSCAIAFMSGINSHPDDALGPRYFEEERHARMPMRILHPTALLGFHGPYVPGNRDLSGAEVADLVFQLNFLSSFLYEQSDAFFFPDQLIGEMLRAADSELYIIDEIGQLNAWSIDLDYTTDLPFDYALLKRACYLVWNRFSYSEGGYGRLEEPDTGTKGDFTFQTFASGWLDEPRTGRLRDGQRIIYQSNVGAEASFTCALIDLEGDYYLRIDAGQIGEREVFGKRISAWQLLPPNTNIISLAE